MYQVINNRNTNLEFNGKGKYFSMSEALDLYDSLGGNAEGFSIVKLIK